MFAAVDRGCRAAAMPGRTNARQHLSIARALLKDPPILILDEATGARDAKTETKLLAALDEGMNDRAIFVTAHRLATIRKANRILMFEAGRIVGSGSFDELIARNGKFAELARAISRSSGELLTPPPRRWINHRSFNDPCSAHTIH